MSEKQLTGLKRKVTMRTTMRDKTVAEINKLSDQMLAVEEDGGTPTVEQTTKMGKLQKKLSKQNKNLDDVTANYEKLLEEKGVVVEDCGTISFDEIKEGADKLKEIYKDNPIQHIEVEMKSDIVEIETVLEEAKAKEQFKKDIDEGKVDFSSAKEYVDTVEDATADEIDAVNNLLDEAEKIETIVEEITEEVVSKIEENKTIADTIKNDSVDSYNGEYKLDEFGFNIEQWIKEHGNKMIEHGNSIRTIVARMLASIPSKTTVKECLGDYNRRDSALDTIRLAYNTHCLALEKAS